MILYSRSIAEKVIKPNGDNVYVLAVHPGAVNTKMQEVSPAFLTTHSIGL
jgi:short-subunit dehydrogenase